MFRIPAYLIVFLVLASCAASKNDYKNITPKQQDKRVHFNMSISEFKTLKDLKMSDFIDDSFRWVYSEPLENETISDIVYYFDKDGEQPLYEMIYIYKDISDRDAAAQNLLGTPNNDKEWLLDRTPYPIKAWKYKNKLIMVAVIPDTEWAE